MKNLYYKLAASAVSAVLAGAFFAPSVFAVADLEISGNAEGSTNTIVMTSTSTCDVTQESQTLVEAEVKAKASTGGNNANGNTGSGVTISTGDALATASVKVTGGNNTAVDPCCCQQECNGDSCSLSGMTSKISGNGLDTINTIVLSKIKNQTMGQLTGTRVAAFVKARAKTGKNNANGNTGGTVGITTGKATSRSEVEVTGGSNSN